MRFLNPTVGFLVAMCEAGASAGYFAAGNWSKGCAFAVIAVVTSILVVAVTINKQK